jgi:hypothetical protein
MTPSVLVRANVAGGGGGASCGLLKFWKLLSKYLAETQCSCPWRNKAKHLPTSELLNDMKLVIYRITTAATATATTTTTTTISQYIYY